MQTQPKFEKHLSPLVLSESPCIAAVSWVDNFPFKRFDVVPVFCSWISRFLQGHCISITLRFFEPEERIGQLRRRSVASS